MRRTIKNESGFTMIELLATITILGILMVVAIGAVSWILDLNEKRYYSTLEKNVALAAESYYADYRASLPKAVGQSRKLLLKTLVEQKYLPDVLDYGKGDCTASSESYVVVTKYSKKDYLYNVYFDCPAYKTRQEDAIKDLSITINFDYDDTKVKEAKASIKINSTEDNKIASYEYIIYKDGQNVYNSENISAGYVDNINRQVKLKDYVPGNIRIVVTAYDMYGNRKTKEKEVAIYNNGLPECGPESPVYNKWTNAKDAKRKVTIKCVDKDIECLRGQYSETFTSDMKTGYITITGTNNKEKKCPVGVYIDKTPPVCGTDDGSKVWTNKNRTVTVQCSDATSGCTTKEGYSKTFSKTTQKGKIEIEDNAGNTTKCEVDVYVDKTPPECGTLVENKSWTSQNTEVGVYCIDGESGCKKEYYSEVITSTTKTKTFTISDNAGNTAKCTVDAYVDKNKPTVPTSEIRKNNSTGAIQKNQNKWTTNTLWWGNFKSTSTSGIDHYEFSEGCTGNKSGNLESYYTYSTDKNTTYCIRAVSKAGVASDWSSPYYFKIDKTPPSCGSNDGSKVWTNKTRYITQACNDSGSGCVTKNYNATFTTQGTTDKITIADNVGHTTTCIVDKYIDLTKPTCSINVNGTKGNNGWYRESNINISLSTNDTGGSAVSAYGLTTSASANYNGLATSVQSDTSGVVWYGHVKDGAGNTNTCNTGLIKVDTVKPTVSEVKVQTNPARYPYAPNTWGAASPGTVEIPIGYFIYGNDSGSGIDSYVVIHAPIAHVKDASGNIFASVEYNGSSNHLHEFKNMEWTGTVRTPLVLPQGTVSYQIDYCLGGRILDAAGNLSDQVRVCLTRT